MKYLITGITGFAGPHLANTLFENNHEIHGLKSIEVRLVWRPPWNKDLMSEDAKLALDIF